MSTTIYYVVLISKHLCNKRQHLLKAVNAIPSVVSTSIVRSWCDTVQEIRCSVFVGLLNTGVKTALVHL
jgi:hypothetical protein